MSRDGNPCIQCDKYVSKCFCATMICTECAESNMGFVAVELAQKLYDAKEEYKQEEK